MPITSAIVSRSGQHQTRERSLPDAGKIGVGIAVPTAEAKANKMPTLNLSAARFHQDLYGKGGGSLARFEVLETDVPAPLSKDQRQMAQVMAHVQAAMVSTRDEEPEGRARRDRSKRTE
jgi:hypothetical protein